MPIPSLAPQGAATLLAVILLLPQSSLAQQENRMRRILEPDRSMASDFQSKTFSGTASRSLFLKPASIKAYDASRHAHTKSFSPRTRSYRTKQAYLPASTFQSSTPAFVEGKRLGPPVSTISVPAEPSLPLRFAREEGKIMPTKPSIPTKSAAIRGTSQGAIDYQQRVAQPTLTIDQIRELLNKN